MRAYISTVYGCPYEGRVSPDATVELVETLLSMGAYQISLGDTIGVATPRQVEEVLLRLDPLCSRDKLALHFHDTRGTALANIVVGLEMGIRTFDAAVGGAPAGA